MFEEMTEQQAREEILKLTKEYCEKYHNNKKTYEKGDRIPYASRVYDSEEMVNLVDSSLEFWLTAGRYTSEFEHEFAKYPSDQVYCIGGDSVYKQLLPYCDTAHVTKIDFAYEADSYFPNLDEMPEWKVTAESDEQTYFDLEYTFVKYERVK